MIDVVIPIGPWVVIDATQARQEKQRRAIVGGRVLDYFTAMFGIHRNRLEPVRHSLAQIFLKESLALDSVWIAPQNQSSIVQKWQNENSHAVIISKQVPLGVAGFREIHLVQIAHPQPFAFHLNGHGFSAAFEQLGFDLGFCAQHAADDLRRTHYTRSHRNRSGILLPLAVSRLRVFAKRNKNWMAQSTFLRPTAEFNARDQRRRNPSGLLIGFGHGFEWTSGRREVFESIA